MVVKKRFTVDNHALVPRHVKLTEKEKQQMFEQYGVKGRGELPRISPKDPALRHLDLKSGDIVKIIRPSPTAGEAFFYREVQDV